MEADFRNTDMLMRSKDGDGGDNNNNNNNDNIK